MSKTNSRHQRIDETRSSLTPEEREAAENIADRFDDDWLGDVAETLLQSDSPREEAN